MVLALFGIVFILAIQLIVEANKEIIDYKLKKQQQFMETSIKFLKVRDVKSPERGTSKSAGIDFFVPNDFNTLVLGPGHDVLIPSGIRMRIPEGFMLMGADKSGIAPSGAALKRANLAIKNTDVAGGATVIGAKIIDEDYPGEIHIHIINVGLNDVYIKPGMKLAQFILVPVSYIMPLEVTTEAELEFKQGERTGGFGSTTNKIEKSKLVVLDLDSGTYFDARGVAFIKSAISSDFVKPFESNEQALEFCNKRQALRLEPITVKYETNKK